MLDLKANPDRPAEGTVIEAKLERGRGAVATVLVQRGTLQVGDIFVAGTRVGPRARAGRRSRRARSTAPARRCRSRCWACRARRRPASSSSWSRTRPAPARSASSASAAQRETQAKAAAARHAGADVLEDPGRRSQGTAVVVKADVQGSVEAIVGSLDEARQRRGLGARAARRRSAASTNATSRWRARPAP